MVTCAICGKRPAAKVIGACSDCLRSLPEGELAPAFHRAAREKLGLPVVPPRVPAGAKCRLCANECQPGPEKNGYCGLRKSARGKLKKASHEAFPLRTVEDKLRHLSAKGLAEMIRLDISSSHNLYFFAMRGWVNRHQENHAAATAENQSLLSIERSDCDSLNRQH